MKRGTGSASIDESLCDPAIRPKVKMDVGREQVSLRKPLGSTIPLGDLVCGSADTDRLTELGVVKFMPYGG